VDVKEYLEKQALEIDRYKWIESEKAGRDLGDEAVFEWIMKHAHEFSAQMVRVRGS
jgi:hypothetical protein